MPTPIEQFKEFFNANAEQDNIALSKAPGAMWMGKGQENAIKTFHIAAETVPAYKDFLRQHKIDHSKIKTFEDFAQVPTTDKEGYLMKYSLHDLCINGDLSKSNIISSSSGSTGNPFYWPRLLEQDLNIAKALETLYVNNFSIQSKSTLLLISLGMGVWTAGEMMYGSGKLMAQKGHPMTVMTPGIYLEEILKILKTVAPLYEQTFIIGYPAFIKDIIDSANNEGIDLATLKLKTLVGGEVFTEHWRDYVYTNGKMTNRYKDITSVLGSSEGGIVGIETPLSVYIRQQIFNNVELNKALFNSEHIPSVVQFNPVGRFIEALKDELVLTNLGGLPLVRYNTKDAGGIMPFDRVMEILVEQGVSKDKVSEALADVSLWTFPFAYLFGRSNVMATIYAVNVYPENIKPALLDEKLRGQVTSRFAMKTAENEKMDQQLEIYVELSRGQQESADLENQVHEMIVQSIKKANGEFNKLTESVTRADLVKVILRPFQDRNYFSSDKQKYVLKPKVK